METYTKHKCEDQHPYKHIILSLKWRRGKGEEAIIATMASPVFHPNTNPFLPEGPTIINIIL